MTSLLRSARVMRRDSLPSCGRRRIINLDETDESSLSCRIDRPPPGEPVLATLKDLAAFHPQLKGATLGSMVYATRGGSGQRKLLMIAHMDTVYTKGMGASQPFRIEGDKAYGLGISDDKGGVALILHTVQLLDQLGFKDYAQLGVLINADEEIGSAGSAAFITQLGGEYDAVLSFEGAGFQDDMVRLAQRHCHGGHEDHRQSQPCGQQPRRRAQRAGAALAPTATTTSTSW